MQDKYIKMLNSGDLYDPRVLGDEQISLRQKVNDYNNTIAEPSSIPLRKEMLRKRLKNAGKKSLLSLLFIQAGEEAMFRLEMISTQTSI